VIGKVFLEGGGDQQRTLTECRKGFRLLFQKIVPEGRQPRLVACGGRKQAYDRFCGALSATDAGDPVLLVDSEAPVTGGVWDHLRNRDGWAKPQGTTENHVHLMVQCMETWFLADKEFLAKYYGQGFNAAALRGNPRIEDVPKVDVQNALIAATWHSETKGQYHKTEHGFDILAGLNPDVLRRCSPHADRLFKALEKMTN